jgi:ABC-type nitrate/sulfonate/bicarbonate transport system ATPase subunit
MFISNRSLEVQNVSYQVENQIILNQINLKLDEGKIYSLIGPSGAGKTTLLEQIAGVQKVTSGAILFGQMPMKEVIVSLVPQDYGLLPWQTVEKAVLTGATISRKRALTSAEKTEIKYLVEEMGLASHLKKYPKQLSGGQKQRVAIARCFASQSAIFLMDEPFSALDAFTREKAQQLFLNCWQASQPLTVFVTHDIEEAVLLADEVIVMAVNPGQIKKRIPSPFSNKLDLIKNRQSLQLFETVQALRKEIEA